MSISLINAAANGDTETLKKLLDAGSDANTKDEQGSHALMHAAHKGQVNCVGVLLASGADPNVKDRNGRTALMFAAKKGYSSCLAALLAGGANPNIKDTAGLSALIIAMSKGHESCVSDLLAAAADPNAKDANGQSPLMLAVANWNAAYEKIQRECRKEDDEDDWEHAKRLAAMKQHESCIKTLLAAGADPHAKNKDGDTALMLAVKKDFGFWENEDPFPGNDWTRLQALAAKKRHEALSALLAVGADLQPKTR